MELAAAGSDSLAWRVRLGEGEPAKVTAVAASAVAAGAAGLFVLRSPALGALGFAIIAASTSEYWWGASYRLNSAGATSRVGLSLSAIEWKDVKRIVEGDAGLTLTPLERDSALSPFRGVYLRYGSVGREALRAAIARFGGEHAERLG